MKRICMALLFILLFWQGITRAQTAPAGRYDATIHVNGLERSYILYLPHSYNTTAPLPLIFFFHGAGATANSMFNISAGTDFTSISERNNVILVAPQGIDKSWNDGRHTKANRQGVDDVVFIATLLNYLAAHYAVDTTRVYATGISNGGFMASRLGCELAGRFAAIAVVAATMGEEVPYATCNPAFTLPAMYIHGTDDPVVKYEGGSKTIGAEGAYLSHDAVIKKWCAIDHCTAEPVVTNLPDIAHDGTTVIRKIYTGAGNVQVAGYTIYNGGHTWPGGRQYRPKAMIGLVCRDFNACEVIWDFFRENKR